MNGVIVKCGYRIHINSIDMNGFTGRCCGGLGFALKNPVLTIKVEESNKDIFNGKYPDKIKKVANEIRFYYKINKKLKITILKEIAEHKGLGSETQLYFALATAITILAGLYKTPDNIATDLKLSGVSGIGYGAFKYGNFIVDTGYMLGKNKKDFVAHSIVPPKIVYNCNIPNNWRVLLFIPKHVISLSKQEEDSFFAMYTPVPESEVKDIAYYTLMGIIPAIEENNFDMFIKSLNVITKLGTKKAELKINEKTTDKILKKINMRFGFAGLSSLGPTCYTFIDTKKTKIDIDKLKEDFNECDIILTSVRNKPFEVIRYEKH